MPSRFDPDTAFDIGLGRGDALVVLGCLCLLATAALGAALAPTGTAGADPAGASSADADGERTTDHDVIYDELFDLARRGLAAQDVPDARIDAFLEPMERRHALGATPSTWQLDRVRDRLADHDLSEAIHETQREYYRLSREHDAFYEWL